MLTRLSLRIRILLFFVALGAGGVAALAGGLALGYARLGQPGTLDAFVQAGVVGGFGILALTAGVWVLFDLNLARPIDVLAGALRARAHAAVDGGIEVPAARYLGDLAPAANAAAQSLAETRNALAEAVARETTRLETEKARLEALLSDVPVGVLLCSADHEVVFYNGAAAGLLGAGGLGRALFEALRPGPIRHAWARLRETDDPDAASDLICATIQGARVLAARMRLVAGGGDRPGYVLTLRDVTQDLETHARREALLAEVFDRIRRPAANIQTLLAALGTGGEAPGRLDTALREEAGALTRAVTELAARHDEGRAEAMPVAMVRAGDLLDGLRAHVEAAGHALTTQEAPLLLRADAFDLIVLLAALIDRLAEAGIARDFTARIDEDGTGATIRLGWQGPALSVGQLDRWLDAALDTGRPGLTGRAVIAAHATEIWPEGAGALVLPVPRARRAVRRPAPVVRSAVYDFDLLSRARNDSVAEARLEDLTYVVFDTETTGLLPAQGDEIVQIAAVRIVNGRRVPGEVLDLLVNPGRPIPPASTEVHGITDAMVAEAPDVDTALRQFHAFAAGAVLVAHNAPFDMTFLRRREDRLGLRFDHPVFDTVLLSAVVWGQAEVHSLDALTHRLGITIPEEARHTAIGDTLATADALLKLMPMLRGRGLATFGQVLVEVRRHGRLLRDLN
ncbi:MAG: DNA polymerase III subunit epsilon [Rhodobacterales bacterium]|nr:DNA polymerase III subunit epsilon [Rhodobacterales bacterium]